MMESAGKFGRSGWWLKGLLVLAASAVLTVWLANTPGGLLGKADAIGYAVCHRIDARSFHLGDRQFPLCARCSGMYLGAILALIFQLVQGRRGSMPSLKTYAILALFVVAFGVDGTNSFLHFFPQAPALYQPSNWLRLVTGTGMGLAMTAVLTPVFHQTMWKTWDTRRALGSFKQIGVLTVLAALLIAVLLTGSEAVLFPLALLSAAGVVVVLTMVYAMVLVMLAKADNTFEKVGQLWLPLVGGFTLALLQIGAIDLVRFALTGTWAGFSL